MNKHELRERARMLIAVCKYLAAELELPPAPTPEQIAAQVSAEGVRRGLFKTSCDGEFGLLIALTEKGRQFAATLVGDARAKMN